MLAKILLGTLFVALSVCGGKATASVLKLLPENLQDFKCNDEAIGFKLNLTELAGYWYEAARIPKVPVECLNVSIPAETKNNSLDLGLTYVSTYNNSWELTKEVVTLPWTNSTQYGIASLDTVDISYKLVTTDYVSIAVICGYDSSSIIPIFKLFTRDREVSQEVYEMINTQAEQYGYQSLISWEKQSLEECGGSSASSDSSGSSESNGSSGQAPLTALMGFIILLCGFSIWGSY
ncbi:uncharacterized protein LOC108105548 [Drosophila eugracilis]|uniref:uncharacterized protein LOC108105548 n=1 Tax=Drosophila eugracilis TaxID=29029 RepID=UPI0007E6ED33|nr:uncharacterized protein LOC108105548 [Drosophila eugracilis]